MQVTIVVLGMVIAIAAAVRSTWSPCGQSMISQLTPVGEASRGNRYSHTAVYYIVGAITGGVTLGALMAVLAAGVDTIGASTAAMLTAAGVAAFAGAIVDSGMLGFAPPFLRRQVNEDWLMRYRAWVYAGGFGWQIGAGITTYIMTAAVFVMIAFGALTASPLAAFVIALAFSLVRGCAVFLTAKARTTRELFALHRRFDALAEPVRRGVICVQGAVVLTVVTVAGGVVGAAIGFGATLLLLGVATVRQRETSSASA